MKCENCAFIPPVPEDNEAEFNILITKTNSEGIEEFVCGGKVCKSCIEEFQSSLTNDF